MKGLNDHQTDVMGALLKGRERWEVTLGHTPPEDGTHRAWIESRIKTYNQALEALKLRWGVVAKRLSRKQREAMRLVAARGHVAMGFEPMSERTAKGLAKIGLVELVPDDDHYQDIYVILTEAGKVEMGAWSRPKTVHRTENKFRHRKA